jgi:hypothetical protein
MRRIAYALVATAAAATLACNGQNNPDANRSGTDMSDRGSEAMNTRSDDNRATLTGCLLAGGNAGSYVLQMASADLSSNGAPSSTPSAMGNSASVTYRIISDKDNGDLEKNLNKRVAINGYVSSNTNGTVGTSGTQRNGSETTGTSGTTANGSSPRMNSGQDASIPASELPSIRPESVRQVSGQCPDTPQR